VCQLAREGIIIAQNMWYVRKWIQNFRLELGFYSQEIEQEIKR